MIQTIIGLILLLAPFLLISKFKNKILGFAYILSFVIAFHLFIAIITQAFHIFTYPVILTINIIIFLIVIAQTNFTPLDRKPRRRVNSLRSPEPRFSGTGRSRHLTGFKEIFSGVKLNLDLVKKIDWILVPTCESGSRPPVGSVGIFMLAIVFICLFSVHYNYSGKYTIITTLQYQEAKNMRYLYPYYSDEWYAVAFIKDSIDSHSLPIKNPLAPPAWNKRFINLEFVFHSFLAEIMLLSHLDPLTNYTLLTVFSGLLICLLIYLFLRHNHISQLSAAIISISTLYITNGANLPGIWTFVPLIMGIISMLLGLFFVETDRKMLFFMSIVTLLFYPPLFVFYSLMIIFSFVLSEKISTKEKIKNISYYLILAAFVAILLSLAYFLTEDHQNSFFSYIFSKLFYTTFTKNAIPLYTIYNIIPIPILTLAIFGIIRLVMTKKKIWLLSMLFLGIAYWILYSLVLFRFIIEYQRVIVVTSILVTITAGFGLNYLINILKKTDFFQGNNILNYVQIAVLILFLVFSFRYTTGDGWQKLKAVDIKTGTTFAPAAPANKYLHPDDLQLFKNIKSQKFLSLPWKGTVIGVATNNYPFSTKPGTISINKGLYYEFMNSDCGEKEETARTRDIHYFYIPKIDCPNFEFINKSSEELYLYSYRFKSE